jgi:ubiquinone/menaquinone biosynthesis C-methylase UbiE
MDTRDALELIRGAIPGRGGRWADLGAGEGTFTRALAELLGPDARIVAVDRDARALASLARWAKERAPGVTTVVADFTRAFELTSLGEAMLDGMLLANALHFVRDPERVLARLAEHLRPGGRVVLVEYDRRRGNPWVPHPIAAARLPEVTAAAGLSAPVFTATRPSEYGGDLYVAVADRLTGAPPGSPPSRHR